MNFNLLPALPALIPVALLFWVMFKEKKEREADSKYPFREKFYRLPGEFANNRARELSEKGEEGLYGITFTCVFAFAVILLTPMNTIYAVTILAVVFLISIFYLRPLHKNFTEARNWRLGALGERVVGDYLMREFLPKHFKVFHDVPQDKGFVSSSFNYDHILVDHRGVFLIETKTRSKKLKTNSDLHQYLTIDGEKIQFPDGRFDANIIPNLKRSVEQLSEDLNDSIQSNIPVYPILVFPGWDVFRDPKTSTRPLCDLEDIVEEIEKKAENALKEKTVKAVSKYFENLTRTVDQNQI